jgi:TM2 domain-containing membrane protein YozV
VVNTNRLAQWVVAVIWNAFWFFLIGGTISILLARNGDGLAAIIVFSVTLLLVVIYVISRTMNLARAFDRASMKQAQRARPKHPMS